MTALVVILAVVVALLTVLVVGLLRSHAEILRALHDLGVNLEDGAPEGGARTFSAQTRAGRARAAGTGVAPQGSSPEERVGANGLALPEDGPLVDARDLMGVTPSGDASAIGVIGTPGLTLLAFLTTGCASCMDFWEAFREPANRRVAGPGSQLVVLTKGQDAESPSAVRELADPALTTLMSSEAFDDYSVPLAPYFVLIDGAAGRVVGEGAASSFDQLGSLIKKAMADSGVGAERSRSRRDMLRGLRQNLTADEALSSAGIGPGHPSLHTDPNPTDPNPTDPNPGTTVTDEQMEPRQ